jgi:ketosteroid isomerase-like protein
MSDQVHDFALFLKRREQISQAYVNGDAAPLRLISTQRDPATFFGPMGGYVAGAEQVFATNQRGAQQFELGGTSNFEVLQIAASDGIAFWVGLNDATVRMQGKTVPMKLRLTEIFRLEDGEWKLVHRHADQLASARS